MSDQAEWLGSIQSAAKDSQVPIDEIIRNGVSRVRAIFAATAGCVKVISSGDHPQFRVELSARARASLTPFECQSLFREYGNLNNAVRTNLIKIVPGFDSFELSNLEAALDIISPGIFDPKQVSAALSSNPQLLDRVGGQWFPPGIWIELTKEKTDKLIEALSLSEEGVGVSEGAKYLIKLGVAAEIASVVALILVIDLVAIKIAKAASAKGAVGFKIMVIPPLIDTIPWPA